METKGKFIVIEGVDGSGKGTQTKLLSDFLSQKYEVLNKHYPEYGTPIGDLIDQWLHKKHEFSPDVQALLYFSDFMKDRELVEKYRENGKMVITDRYFTTTIVYQAFKGTSLEKLLKLAGLFNLSKPDICIYLRISGETSLARKSKEKPGNLDRHEEDKNFQNAVVQGFDKVAAENVFCEWVAIDAEKPAEEVFEEIKKTLNEKLGI
ncbi:MAG: dTMP kinase [Candidatus Paceibacterota bacterium]